LIVTLLVEDTVEIVRVSLGSPTFVTIRFPFTTLITGLELGLCAGGVKELVLLSVTEIGIESVREGGGCKVG